ncbi:MAG: glutamate synthase-related protein [Bacilli bacterium]
MAKYRCQLCGYIYDEEKEGIKFKDLPDDWQCPMCLAPKEAFELVEETVNDNKEANVDQIEKSTDLTGYLKEYTRVSDSKEKNMQDIHTMAMTGQSIISAMGTSLPVISWDDILILGSQLKKMPLFEHEDVSLKTVIGKHAKQPMVLETPVFVSHMSFGALSKEAKTALAIGTKQVKTAICSGEGGILPEEFSNAYQYIFEYVPNKYSLSDENLQKVSAIEIKIGQGTKPGMGGHLPGAKVTEEIAKIRGKEVNQDIISPSKFPEIKTKEDLQKLVSTLRKKSKGRPIGIKIAAEHIEEDLEFACFANPDFITIDGRGGATGASPKIIKDATTVPTIYALYRARKYLNEHHQDIDLIITGGLRTSSDFAKAIAMGASAVAIATAAMIAIGCQQYRICQTGKCPVGIATQDPELRKRFNVEKSSQRLTNYFNVINEELKTFARITGNTNIHDLSVYDLVTTNDEIAKYTNIKHV